MDLSGRIALGAVIFALASSAQAAADAQRPELFRKLVECRQIPDVAARAACYDAQVDSLDRAEKKGEVVIVDRAEVKKARRSLFGLRLPDLSLFGREDARREDEAEFRKIEATLKSASMDRNGRWMFELDDGAVWRQSDSESLTRPAKPGQTINIRKAAMGSYFANVNGQRAIRVRREN